MRRRQTYVPPVPSRRPGRRAPRQDRSGLAAGAVVATAAIALTGVTTAFACQVPSRSAEGGVRAALPSWTASDPQQDQFTAQQVRPSARPASRQVVTSSPWTLQPASGASASASATASSSPSASASSSVTASTTTSTGADSTGSATGTPEHLFSASSPWNTALGTSAQVDPQSGQIVSNVLNNRSLVLNMALYSYGIPFYTATASTPRVQITGRGATGVIPVDPSWQQNSGADRKINIIDPTTHSVYEIDGFNAAARSAYWMVKHDYTTGLADGYPSNGELRGPTGSGMSQSAGVIRLSDISSGTIDHALAFVSSNPVAGKVRYPASQTDGRGSGVGVEEGMRVQLDPSLDVDSIPGITPGEKMVAKALQKYGAFCVDTGAGSNQAMGFYAEKPTGGKADPYKAAGFAQDWATLPHIPRDRLRVLTEASTPRP